MSPIAVLVLLWLALGALLIAILPITPGTRLKVEAEIWGREVAPLWIELPVAGVYWLLWPLVLVAWARGGRAAAQSSAADEARAEHSERTRLAQGQIADIARDSVVRAAERERGQ